MMGLQNQFGVLLIGINLLIPSLTQALTLEPLKIDSSQGEPLYAEIPFYNAESTTPIKVSIAQPFEYGHPEVISDAQISHLNFYVRQNAQGNGVIVITSSRPIQESGIDLMLKIQDGSQTRLQQMRTKLPSRIDRLQNNLNAITLKPKIIRNEKDIELNLPTTNSTQTAKQEQTLNVQRTAPPTLAQKTPFIVPRIDTKESEKIVVSQLTPEKVTPAPALTVTAAPSIPTPQKTEYTAASSVSNLQNNSQQEPKTKQLNAILSAAPPNNNSDNIAGDSAAIQHLPNLTINISRRSTAEAPVNPKTSDESTATPELQTQTIKPTASKSNIGEANSPQRHQVGANESLWKIAADIAAQQNASIQQVMTEIKTQNPHAFVNGNANRLKQGVVLNLSQNHQPLQTPVRTTASTPKSAPVAAIQSQKMTTNKQTDAHMSIVTNNKGTIQGSDKNTDGQKERNELTIQVKQQRQTTLGLQNNVRTLDQQLKDKEQRIALLNARLAELEQQLKLRQEEKKKSQDGSNTTSKTQSLAPALMTDTLIVFADLPKNTVITSSLQELV